MTGACDGGNGTSGSIKCGEFHDWLQNRLESEEGLCSIELIFSLFGWLCGWLVGYLVSS